MRFGSDVVRREGSLSSPPLRCFSVPVGCCSSAVGCSCHTGLRGAGLLVCTRRCGLGSRPSTRRARGKPSSMRCHQVQLPPAFNLVAATTHAARLDEPYDKHSPFSLAPSDGSFLQLEAAAPLGTLGVLRTHAPAARSPARVRCVLVQKALVYPSVCSCQLGR